MLTSMWCLKARGDGLADVLVDERPVLPPAVRPGGQPRGPRLHHIPGDELGCAGVLFLGPGPRDRVRNFGVGVVDDVQWD